MASPLLPALLAACTSDGSPIEFDDVATGGEDVDSAEQIGTVGDDTAPDTGDRDPPETWPKACDEIYDPDTLPEFDLSFTDEAWSALQANCSSGSQAYEPVTFGYAGESVDAMVRLKGNWSWSCDKLQFVVSFDETDPDGRFHGLRKIVLDAPWYDRTLLHERLAFPLFAARGLPYSCANNARVTVNGAYYGLYANTERIDHEYLERNFEASDGNLYQGGSELKTNEDVGDTSDLAALQAAGDVDAIDALADLDEGVAEWAMEAMIPALDNYWAGVEINYYLYDHPSRGFVWLPYDLDLIFGDSAYTDGTPVWPDVVTYDPILWEHSGWHKEALVETVLANPYWCSRFVEELENARAVYDPAALAASLDAWNAQIEDSLAADPHKPFSTADHDAAVEDLRAFFQARADYVDAWLAEVDHCPARW